MKSASLTFAICIAACSHAFAQNSAGSTGAGGSGSTLSNGSTINGTGGSPGPNTSNALNHGTTGKNLGATHNSVSDPAAATRGNAVDTPTAQSATKSLGNTDTGILKK
jgi:hypothetical protein